MAMCYVLKKVKTEKLKVKYKMPNLIFIYSLTFKFKLLSYDSVMGILSVIVVVLIVISPNLK